MKTFSWSVMAALLLALALTAAAAQGMEDRLEMSMLVSGTIQIDPDGSVAGHQLDRPEKLPRGVVVAVENAVAGWRFEPVETPDGPTVVQATMSMLVVARGHDEDSFELSVQHARFGNEGDVVRWHTAPRATYPRRALEARVSGTVYLLLAIGPGGEVQRAHAGRVDLTSPVASQERERYRNILAQAASRGARNARVELAEEVGVGEGRVRWVLAPIDFVIGPPFPTEEQRYGRWTVYLPGKVLLPEDWEGVRDDVAVETYAGGGVYLVNDRGPRLATPPAAN